MGEGTRILLSFLTVDTALNGVVVFEDASTDQRRPIIGSVAIPVEN
jgi:hypothetical protein